MDIPEKMNAALMEGLESVQVREVSVPTIRPGTLLLRVAACGICGSDLRTFKSGNPRIKYPAILGHEFAGEVVAIGEKVSGFAVGDRLAIGADIPCGECKWCRAGISNNCVKFIAIGYQLQGAFAEYCLLDELVLRTGPVFRLPEKTDYVSASLMEPLACCLNGTDIAGVGEGKSVLIIGGGPIGCMLALLSRSLGASKVMLSETSEKRLSMSKKAVELDKAILGSGQKLKEEVLAATNGEGVDIVFTACPSVEAQEDGIELLTKRGCINFFGGVPSSARKAAISSNKVHYDEIKITGSHGSTPAHNKRALDMIASGKIDLRGILTHRVSLANIKDGFDLLASQEALKVTVMP